MGKRLYPCIILCFLSSCVTLFNGPFTTVNISVPHGTEVIYKEGLTAVIQQPTTPATLWRAPKHADDDTHVYISARRNGSKPLTVVLKKDNIEKTISVPPGHSWLYYANIYPLYGLGFLVDHKNPNRFSYPNHIYIYPDDQAEKGYHLHPLYKTPRWEWVISPPLTNIFVFKFNDLYAAGGPFGISTGINYYYSERSFISAEAGIALVALFHPDGEVLALPESPFQRQGGKFINIRNNHNLGRFDIGYGLSAADHLGSKYYPPYRNSHYVGDSVVYTARACSIGGSFTANYRITRSFYAGINYQLLPFSIDRNMTFNYEYIISFGCSWRLNFNSFY